MLNKFRTPSLENIIFFLLIVSLPFDGVPFILPSSYRPATIFLIAFSSVYVFIKIVINDTNYFQRLISKPYIYLWFFFIITVTSSFLNSLMRNYPLAGTYDFLITIILGLITFIVFDFLFYKKSKVYIDSKTMIKRLFETLALVYLPVLAFGLVETLVLVKFLQIDFKISIVRFTAFHLFDRIQLFSAEPSWASMQLLFIMPVYMYLSFSKSKKYIIGFVISLFLFFIGFSMQGYLTLGISIIIYVIIYRNKIKWKYIFAITSILIILLVLTTSFVSSNLGDVYYISRIEKFFNIRSISEVLFLDGSVFVRLFYPYAGIMMFRSNFLLGVGGGNFRYAFKNILINAYPQAVQFKEVANHILNGTANVKNFYSRILGETGIIGAGIFFSFLIGVFRKYSKFQIENKEIITMWIIIIFANMLQFDSFVYIKLWFVLSLILNLTNIKDEQNSIITEDTSISIAMATYNGEKYITEQINSILIQMRENDEIIISDDESNDRTIEIIESLILKDSRIKVIRGNRLGHALNFERAIMACGNPIIFLSDQDDVWNINKIEKTLEQFKSNSTLLMMHNADLIDENGNLLNKKLLRKFNSGVFRNILKSSYWGHCMAFRKDLLHQVIPFPKNIMYHDQWISIISEDCKSSHFLDESLVKHRIHTSNVSKKLSFTERIEGRLNISLNYLAYLLRKKC